MNSDKQNFRPTSASTMKKINLPPQTGDLDEYISNILYEHQKACEKSGKYIEAEAAKRRLQELKKDYEDKTKGDIRFRHQNEKQEIERAHLDEFNQFNEFWDNKMAEFEEEANKVKNQIVQRHDDELKQFVDELEQSIPQVPKDSAELLNLKKTEGQLARQESYMEAHHIQQRILQLEQEEGEKWAYQRNQKIKNLVQQLKLKQQTELTALQQRIISGQEEQRKQRSVELEKQVDNQQLITQTSVKILECSQGPGKLINSRTYETRKNLEELMLQQNIIFIIQLL